MSKLLKVGIIQQSNTADISSNRQNLINKIRTLANQGAELVVLQELHDSLYFCQVESTDNFDIAIKLDGEECKAYSNIAKECGMSYSYFAKKFSSVYGKTCKEYIEEMRFIKVEDFLLFTDFDLNYISQETGFSDCSHMIKCFKRHKGITPKKFRQHKPNHKNLS